MRGFRLGLSMDEIPKPLQVYLVEDSTIIRRLLASAIEAAGGALIGSSANARSAIADLAELRPDLIVIDLNLDSGSGFDVLRALQDRNLVPWAIKVVLTNHAHAEYRNLSFRLGVDGFFDKASDTSQVLALINALAAQKGRAGSLPRGPNYRERGSPSKDERS